MSFASSRKGGLPALALYALPLSALLAGVGSLGALAGCGPVWGSPALPIAESDALDLSHTHRPEEQVLLYLDLRVLRSAEQYPRLQEEMEEHCGLSAATVEAVRPLLDRTEEAVGLLFEGEGETGEGVLFVNGSFTRQDFDTLLGHARTESGREPERLSGAGDWPLLYGIGDASVARFSERSWAFGHGPRARSYLRAINQGGRDRRIDIGPRFGLPPQAMQAWADRDTAAGARALRLVLHTEPSNMVTHLVNFIRGRLTGER